MLKISIYIFVHLFIFDLSIYLSIKVGNSLQAVNLLLKKNKMLAGEIANHEPRVNSIVENGTKLISEGHPQVSIYLSSIYLSSIIFICYSFHFIKPPSEELNLGLTLI